MVQYTWDEWTKKYISADGQIMGGWTAYKWDDWKWSLTKPATSNNNSGQNQTNIQTTQKTTQNNNQKSGVSTYNPTTGYYEQQGQSQNNNQNNYDPNEKFDSSSFTNPNAKVQIKAGQWAITWQPDYQDNSDARMQEITNNLNSYWNTNREFFKDRETYNKMFNYASRNDEQKALLDSYWKKADDRNKASQYTTAEWLNEAMKNADITPDQMNYIKESNPELYSSYQEKMENDIKLNIANMTVPADATSTAELLTQLVEKLDIQAGVPYDFIQRWDDALEKYNITADSKKLSNLQTQIYDTYEQIWQIESRIRGESAGASESLIQSRIAKATSSLYGHAQALQYWYNTILQWRQQNLAIATQDLNAYYQQTQEDQRIFNNKLSSLWFAMDVNSYRTPEQQAQLQLQTQLLQNDINLLNQAKSTQLQSQLNSELTDLSVKDPKQLRANLNNVLSQYYDQYWMMIQRSQSQVVDDVLAYAEKNGVSVAQALSENFIKPLQSKPQYQALLNNSTGYSTNSGSQKYKITQNSDGTTSIVIEWTGEIPAWYTRAQKQNLYSTWFSNATSLDDIWVIVSQFEDGSNTGQCGAFANDVAQAMGSNIHFWSKLSEKTNPTGDYTKSDVPVVGSFAVFNSSSAPGNGHVGVVTQVNSDGSFVMKSSNQTWEEQLYTSTHQAGSALTFIVPSVDFSKNQMSYNPDLEPLYNKYNAGQKSLTSEEWKTIDQAGITRAQFMNQATNFKAQQDAQLTPAVQELISQLEELKEMNWVNYWTATYWDKWVPYTKWAYYRSLYNKILASTALQNLIDLKSNGATFGALSDNELKFITDSATNLNFNLRYSDFMDTVDQMIVKLQKWVSGVAGWNVVNLDLSSDYGDGSNYFSDMMSQYS